MIVALSLLIVQCTSEYEPIAGPPGMDGISGVDGTASCIGCHSRSHRDSISAAYNLSLHAIESIISGVPLSTYTNRTSCARCHTNEGFIEFMETGAVQDTVPLPTRISCTSCHSNHKTFDFENDGQDYALRSIEPVQLIVDETYNIDLGGTSNQCVSCHQPRRSGPEDDGSGTFEVPNTRWGPHHGPQSTLLEGIQGAELSGSTSYPAPKSAAHRANSNCVQCHMNETTDGFDGSHTFLATNNACIQCHTNGVPTEVAGLAAELETLGALLANVVSQDGTVVGIIQDGEPQEGTFTFIEAQAAWNYLFIMEDSSEGLHNPEYAKALIRNSIEALD